MQFSDINIRDPFVLREGNTYYMYGTRARNFGRKTHGFDVYVSENLKDWSEPRECFNSRKFGLDREANWAPEVHKYKDAFYMFATFTGKNRLRGTYILRSDSPMGPFRPHSDGAATPWEWECLDGTLYIEDGRPYLVFCHEHTQIIDGTICYVPLKDDLTGPDGDPVTLFAGSEPYFIEKKPEKEHYITDGPFMYRTGDGTLYMIWSTFIKGKYAECIVYFPDGTITGNFMHIDPLIDDDGGHGMIFNTDRESWLILHSPNTCGKERPKLIGLNTLGSTIRTKQSAI